MFGFSQGVDEARARALRLARAVAGNALTATTSPAQLPFGLLANALRTSGNTATKPHVPQVSRPPQQDTLRPYIPTLRDDAASWILDRTGNGATAQRLVEGLLGSTGVGHTKTSVADVVPLLSQVLQAEEGGQQIGAGNHLGGALNVALAAIPVPAAAKGVAMARGLMGSSARAAEADAARAVGSALPDAVQAATPPIIAYHGSPHQFDAFDLSKIGTGEGAQAYGHGLYFAENEGVAKAYRDALKWRGTDWSDPESVASYWLEHHGGNRDAAQISLASAKYSAQQNPVNHPDQAANQAVVDAIDLLRGGYNGKGAANTGHMYQVGINADPSHFLDWDAPLSQQHPAVQSALANVGIRPGGVAERQAYMAALPPSLHPLANNMIDAPADALTGGSYDDAWTRLVREAPNADHNAIHDIRRLQKQPEGWYAGLADPPATGADIYHSLRQSPNSYGHDASAAEVLQQAGIPGIKYLDQGSRAAGDGTRNYVVFNPQTIDILKRYGLPVGLTGAGMDAALNTAPQNAQQPQQQPPPTTPYFGFGGKP